MKIQVKNIKNNKMWIQLNSTNVFDSTQIETIIKWIHENCNQYDRGPTAMKYNNDIVIDTYIISHEDFLAFKLVWLT